MSNTYTREFKIEAVHLAEASDKTYAEVAEDLGVCDAANFWTEKKR